MEEKTRELAVQALNNLLVAMSQNAGAQPCCSEEFASKSEYIRSLSQAIANIHPVALEASKEIADFANELQSQPDQDVSLLDLLRTNNEIELGE